MNLEKLRKNAINSGKKKFKEYHFEILQKLLYYTEVEGKTVCILGCSSGLDCQLFILAGAKKVFGIDLDPRIGSDYESDKVHYIQSSVSDIELEAEIVDIVYSVAVFEHVFDISGALHECKRILKPDGIGYIFSSPLWNGPYGHHFKNMMEYFPWIHLVLKENQLVDFLIQKGIRSFEGKRVESMIAYLHNPFNFNRYPALFYSYAAKELNGVDIIMNKISQHNISSFQNLDFFNRCLERGYSQEELLSTMHLLVFRKQ